MPANILNLPAYTVNGLRENAHDYHIDATTKAVANTCRHCGYSQLEGFGRREQMVKDLPMHGKRVGIYIDTRRYRCKSCRKTFYEQLPEINEKRSMTNRLVDWIGKQSVKRTFASIADEVGVVEGTVRLIFKDYVADLSDRIRFETPKWMGIDEIHLIRPRGVIANIQNNTIVELLPNRSKETMIRYLSNLEGRQQVQYVAMDMWAPYRDACQTVMPDARIVIDKFHVVRMANDAMEKVRKGLRERLTLKQKRGLMHDRFVLLKREYDLSDQEALLLSGWVKNYEELGLAHRLKEDFFRIYDAKAPDEAQALFIDWKRRITPEVAPAFADLVRAWDNWAPWILGYFDHPVTNAYTESLKSLIRVMNRLGRGYSFEALRAKILFAEGAFKKHHAKPEFVRTPQPAANKRNFETGFSRVSGFDLSNLMSLTVASSTESESREINYGPDISTLARMIEAGEL